MKRLVCLLLCMAMLPTLSAMAEAPDDVWVSGYDYQYYYHSVENCRLARNSGVLSRQALSDIGDLTPCPVCVEDAAQDADITCFERGGTLVIRIPDAYIRKTMFGASEPAGVPEALLHENANQLDDIARLIHGADYCRWAEAALPGTEQAFEAVIPDLDAEKTGALLMSRRHIGSAWVLVVRPNFKIAADYALSMVFYSADLRVSNYDVGSILSQGGGSRRWSGEVRLSPQPSAGKVVFKDEENWTDLQPYVISDGGVNVAVFRNAYDDGMTGLGELENLCQRTPLAGYVDGKYLVFICALTDGEVAALVDKDGFSLWPFYGDDGAEQAPAPMDHEPTTSVTLPNGTVATMDQAEYPVGTGFVSFTLTRPEGGIASYTNEIVLSRLDGDRWEDGVSIAAYVDGDPERQHSGHFCDHVTLVLPLENVGALDEGLYRLMAGQMYDERSLEFRVTEDAPKPSMPGRRVFGGEGLIVMPHEASHADAETYNSCMDDTRVYEGGSRTTLLAGDTVFELRGVDESWGWGICSAYNLFAYPEGHPEKARQILANFDHSEATMYDLGDGLLLCDDSGNIWRCDYDGGNLAELYRGRDDGYIADLIPVGGGVYIIDHAGVYYAALDDFKPKRVYDLKRGVLNGTSGSGYAVYAEGQLILADKAGIFALDTLHPNADGALAANYLTNEYNDDFGGNGLGYIVLGGRLYYWSEKKQAMLSMKLDGTDIQEVSKTGYWFNSVTSTGCVLALSGSEPGMFGDERTEAALFFPNDPENPTFDPDHCKKHMIQEDSFDYVLGDYYYHRDEEDNETRTRLAELDVE